MKLETIIMITLCTLAFAIISLGNAIRMNQQNAAIERIATALEGDAFKDLTRAIDEHTKSNNRISDQMSVNIDEWEEWEE